MIMNMIFPSGDSEMMKQDSSNGPSRYWSIQVAFRARNTPEYTGIGKANTVVIHISVTSPRTQYITVIIATRRLFNTDSLSTHLTYILR